MVQSGGELPLSELSGFLGGAREMNEGHMKLYRVHIFFSVLDIPHHTNNNSNAFKFGCWLGLKA